VGHRAILNAVVKRKIPSPHQESNPRTPIVQPIVIHTYTLLKNKYGLLVNTSKEAGVTS